MLIHTDTYKNWYLDPRKPHNVGVLNYTHQDHNKVFVHKRKTYIRPWLKRLEIQ